MYGNLHVSTEAQRPPVATLWLAGPAAQDYFAASSLSDADRARWSTQRNPRRQEEFKVSRALKHAALDGTDIHSLSHSGGHAALLSAGPGTAVGVDLELGRQRDVLKIARFSFHEQEVATLAALSDDARSELFYIQWTFKEALAKALRLGLIDALRHCVLVRNGPQWRGSAPTSLPWTVQVFRPRPELYLAAACVGPTAPLKTQMWEWPPRRAGNWPRVALVDGKRT